MLLPLPLALSCAPASAIPDGGPVDTAVADLPVLDVSVHADQGQAERVPDAGSADVVPAVDASFNDAAR